MIAIPLILAQKLDALSISVFGVTLAFLRKVFLLFSWFDGLCSLAVEVHKVSLEY